MKTGRYRFAVALLLFVAGVINYMDRAALGVAGPTLTRDLELTPSEFGFIQSSFFFGYAIFAFVGGHLADRFGPVRVYAWAAGSWSALCALTGAVSGATQLLVVRALFGFTEGPMNSTTNRTITNWFPREETSRTIGFTFSGQPIGAAIAAPVVGFLILACNWRIAFLATGAIGLLWVVAWRYFVTDQPRDNGRVGPDELRLVAASRAVSTIPEAEHSGPLLPILLRASTLALGLGMFAVNYSLYIFITWLPTYLTDALHMDLKQMSIVAAIPWACGFLGYVGGGVVGDFAYLRMRDRLAARKLTTIAPLGLAGLALIAVNFAPGAVVAVTLIALAVLLLTSSVQSCWATIHELIPQGKVGGVSGFIHLLSNISGIIGPYATGYAVQHLGGYDSAFIIAAALALAGVLAMTIFVRRPGRLDPPLATLSGAA